MQESLGESFSIESMQQWGSVHVFELDFLKHKALIPQAGRFPALIPASQISCMSCQQTWVDQWIYPLWPLVRGSKSSAADSRPFLRGTMISITIYFQTQRHGEKSCGALHLASSVVAIVGKEQNETSWGLNPSCTCTNYAIYAKNAKNAIYIKYVLDFTLVTVLATAVGAVTFVTTTVQLRLRLKLICLNKMQMLR